MPNKDMRCFFSNGTLYVSAELNDSLKEHKMCDELDLNAARIATTWGVPIEVKSSSVLDGMEAKYHQSLHMMAVKDMMDNVHSLRTIFKSIEPKAQ